MRYRGKKFDFCVRKKRLPTGITTCVEMVEHPGAVLIVPFVDKDRLIFLRQYRPVLRRYLWELPAGTLDTKESPLRCAQRELIEETDFRARRITRLGRIHPVPGYSTEVIHIYKAEGLVKTPGVRDADEVIEIKVLSRPQVKNLFQKRHITDAKTIAALAFCGWL